MHRGQGHLWSPPMSSPTVDSTYNCLTISSSNTPHWYIHYSLGSKHYTCTQFRSSSTHLHSLGSIHYTCTQVLSSSTHLYSLGSIHYTCDQFLSSFTHLYSLGSIHYTCTQFSSSSIHLYSLCFAERYFCEFCYQWSYNITSNKKIKLPLTYLKHN